MKTLLFWILVQRFTSTIELTLVVTSSDSGTDFLENLSHLRPFMPSNNQPTKAGKFTQNLYPPYFLHSLSAFYILCLPTTEVEYRGRAFLGGIWCKTAHE